MTGKRIITHRVFRVLLFVCIGLLLIAQSAPAPASGGGPKVVIISLHGEVNDLMRDRLKRQAEEAIAAGASTIVLRMDTWGGMVTSALEMCDQIKSLKVPTIAWVKPKAISAGAMISLACDKIVISDPARIGDCQPITGTGQSMGAAEREKVETVIRGEFRDSGTRHGYPLALCTAMVTRGPAVYEVEHADNHAVRYVFATELAAYGLSPDEAAAAPKSEPPPPPETPEAEKSSPLHDIARNLMGAEPDESTDAPSDENADAPAVADPASMQQPYDPGQWRIVRQVVGEKQLFTMVGNEPIQYGFAQARVVDEPALADYLHVSESSIMLLQANWSEKLADFLTSIPVRGLLTIILLMAIYSEMHSPGLGIAGAVAIVAGALLLGAPYLTGLADMWELLIVLLGLILLGVELFLIPGFGVVGFSGLLLMFIGLLLTFVPDEPGPGFIPELSGTWDALFNGVITLVTSFVIAVIGMMVLARYLGSMPLFSRLIMSDAGITEPPAAGPEVISNLATDARTQLAVCVGDVGHAINDLRPAGRAQFGPMSVDVVTDGAWIESGSSVAIVTIAGNRVVVRQA